MYAVVIMYVSGEQFYFILMSVWWSSSWRVLELASQRKESWKHCMGQDQPPNWLESPHLQRFIIHSWRCKIVFWPRFLINCYCSCSHAQKSVCLVISLFVTKWTKTLLCWEIHDQWVSSLNMINEFRTNAREKGSGTISFQSFCNAQSPWQQHKRKLPFIFEIYFAVILQIVRNASCFWTSLLWWRFVVPLEEHWVQVNQSKASSTTTSPTISEVRSCSKIGHERKIQLQ